MAGRGQRNKLDISGVSAEIALMKMSHAATEAAHEVKRVSAEPYAEERPRVDVAVVDAVDADAPERISSPLAAEPVPETDMSGFAPLDDEPEQTIEEPSPSDEIQHGVTTEQGEWVDLTAQLRKIDEENLLSSMEVQAAIARAIIPADRVRDAYFIAPAGEGAPKVLAILWTALRKNGAAALVKWTKRKNQALGAVIARGNATKPWLVLLELEWEANLNPVPARALLSPAMEQITSTEVAAAIELIDEWATSGSVFERIRDERNAARADLLERARAGRVQTESPRVEFPAPEAPAERLRELLSA